MSRLANKAIATTANLRERYLAYKSTKKPSIFWKIGMTLDIMKMIRQGDTTMHIQKVTIEKEKWLNEVGMEMLYPSGYKGFYWKIKKEED